MSSLPPRLNPTKIWLSLVVAGILFTWVFWISPCGNAFWLRLHVSTLVLTLVAVCFDGMSLRQQLASRSREFIRAVGGGVLAATALYAIFWVGREAVTRLLPQGAQMIGRIYELGDQTPRWWIAVGLLCVVGPCEEIFWRGYVQKRLQALYGARGIAITIGVYTAVHLASNNIVLIGAAFVCGTFWGLMLWRVDSLVMNMVSHGLWAATVFAICPLA